MIWMGADGTVGTGGSVIISNDFVGTLGNNQKAIGPFETSTGTDGLAGCAINMCGIRSDVNSSALHVGCIVTSGSGWGANGSNALFGISTMPVANSRAYSGISGQGGLAWSYAGVSPANVHDGLGVAAAVGNTKKFDDIMDFGLVASSANTLSLQLVNQSSANSDSLSKGFSYVTLDNTNGGFSGVGDVVIAQLPTPTAPTLTKVGAHTAGATTCTYAVVAKTATGQTVASSTTSQTNCLATLDGSNSVTIAWPAVNGAQRYDVYRTAGHSSTGLIASDILASNAASIQSGVGLSTVYFVSDTGLGGGSETLPTAANGYRNTAAGIKLGSVSINAYGTTGNNAAMVFANGASVPISGTMSVQTTVVGNVGGGTDDMMTYTIPANTLGSNGRTLRITAWGSTANNANAKTLAHSFGGSATLSQSMTTSIAGRWKVTLVINRTASGAQDWTYEMHEGTATLSATDKSAIAHGTTSITDSATIVSKFTAAATADNDITQEGMIVEVLN